ncbi:thiolase C-terminal domain-containing protein [Dactylosporangium salmoneum]|uniref:Lipid-transfer protein n=1 Tax=Dactylosporangium salmoneum TaxID=53361 RepID=A0ABN3H8D2_9ACTN
MNGTGTFVAGVGRTDFSRRSGRSVAALGAAAAVAALRDSGLAAHDVDAVIPVGGSLFTEDLMAALGLRDDVLDAYAPPGGNAGIASIGLADVMLRSGTAEVVLIVLARNGRSGSRIARRVGLLPGQQFREALEQPHGWVAPAQWYAMIARRHLELHGTPVAALAEVALTMRAHAQLNRGAQMYGRPITRADYDASPYVTEPYRLLDCCLETDGAVAVILTSRDRGGHGARDIPLLACRTARPESADDLTNRRDWMRIGLTLAAPAAFEAAGLGPEDVDAAMIYDCFTFEVLHQLEEAGFCARGGAAEFVLSGRIRLGGQLPVNTHGGLLSEGHLLGLGHVAESVRQLRAEADRRQVDGARVVAVTGWGDWGDGSLALFGRRER